jgi:hypothetical protein
MGSTWAKRSGNFTESDSGVKQVLEDILSEVQIKALVIETQVFEIFAANSIHDLSRGNVWVIVTRNIAWRFILQSSTRASA